MRRIGYYMAGAAVLLALSGCAGAPSEEPAEKPVSEETTETGRLTAPAPEDAETGEAALLEAVRGFRAVPILDAASDEEIIAAANEACAQLEAGTRLVDIDVIDGEDPAQEGVLLSQTAHEFLCPDAPMDTSIIP